MTITDQIQLLLTWFQQQEQEGDDNNVFSIRTLFLPLVLLITTLFYLYKQQTKHKLNLPPSPFKLPIIGNLHQLGTFPHLSLHTLSKKYGPLMLIHLGQVPTIVVSSKAIAEEIMKTHDLIFSSRPNTYAAHKLLYGKDIAFAPYGEYWRQVRKISILELLSPKRVESFRAIREEEVVSMLDRISNSSTLGSVVNLSELILSLTNDIVCRVALGRKCNEDKSGGSDISMKRMMAEFSELLGTFYAGDFIPCLSWVGRLSGFDERAEKIFKEYDELFERILKEHEDGKKRQEVDADGTHVKDFVDVLLQIQKQESFSFAFTKDHIKALIMDMFAAGTDTIYTAIEWTMTELLRHPDEMRKVTKEVRNIAKGQSMVTEDKLHQLNYLQAVIKESMRIHPPLPLLVPRESTKAAKIQGYDIPTKTRVFINAWAIGRDPQVWEEPNKFKPKRFMNGGNKSHVDLNGHDFELLPFGAGRRGCPGIHFAVGTFELALANFLYKFDWEVPNGEVVDVEEVPALTIHKKMPLLLLAKPYCQ